MIPIRAGGKSNRRTNARIIVPQNNLIINFCKSKLKYTWEA
jgi:hypothetical protein